MSLDHRLTAEHEELRRTVEEFAHDVVAPKIGDFYERHEFPYEIVREMGRMGLFGLPFPEEYGGMGGDYLALGIALEELARVDSSVAITLEAGVSLGAMPVYRFGTEEQKQRWLPKLCSGEALGAFGLTEPDGGSDAGGTRTTAVRDEATGEWVINGSKCFITNSGTDITELVTVTAVTGRKENGAPRISSIIVPSGTPVSPSPPRTPRSAGTPRTPASCPSPTSASRWRTCWARRAAATPSSCASWTRAGSPSPPCPRAWRRAASTSR